MYCSSCGMELKSDARFCRGCGSPQTAAAGPLTAQPLPPSPVARTGGSQAITPAVLAMLGGGGLCFMVLYATVYQPLHLHYPVYYGGSVYFGDVLAFASGVAAIVVGALLLAGPRDLTAYSVVLALAGLPTLVIALMWTFASTFDLEIYSHHFYTGIVYFVEFGQVQIGSRYVQVLLLASCAMVLAAALSAGLANPRRAEAGGWAR